jgi:acyl carrier protein
MFEKLKSILVSELQLEESEIRLEAELINDLGINSLELADLILLCEEQFKISIKDEDIHKFITVGDVVTYLETISA